MGYSYGFKLFGGGGAGGSGVGTSSTTQVLFNSSGSVAGDAGLTYDATGRTLVLDNSLYTATAGIAFGPATGYWPRLQGYGGSLQLVLASGGYAAFTLGDVNSWGFLALEGVAGWKKYATGVVGATDGGSTPAFTGRVAVAGIQNLASKVLTLGSNTDFIRINFPASSSVTVTIEGSVSVSDSADPVQRKVHGARYSVSAYRLATGNAVAGAVSTESDVTEVYSVGDALTQAITVTGDANGILIGTNVTVGSGLTAPNTGVLSYTPFINGTGGAAIAASAL